MQTFTFIHAADLHLDAVLPGPAGGSSPELEPLLAGAVFSALERLVNLCIAEQASFLVLSGDVFHGGAGSLKAGFALSDACKRLAEHGIEVFWALGNHDSISQSDEAMRWPANLHIFGAEAERLAITREGAVIAELHGLSHKSRHERANLSERIIKDKSPAPGKDIFKIGVLHCAVHGAQGTHVSYAPCNLSDLTGGGKDYWALGHVHTPVMLASEPPVVYSGSLQGLHINESGPHGCYIVEVNARGVAEARFQPLAPVRWEKLRLDLEKSDLASLDALEDAALEQLRALAEQLGSEETSPGLLQLRLELFGRSALDSVLRKSGSLGEFTSRLNAALSALDRVLPLAARVKDISLATSPDVDVTALLQSDDLVGETLRRALEVADTLDKLAAEGISDFAALEDALSGLPWGPDFLTSLSALYSDRRLADAEALPGVAELAELSREAASLCLHHFEVES